MKRFEVHLTPGELNFLEVAVDTLLEQLNDVLSDTSKPYELSNLIERIEDGESLTVQFKKLRKVKFKTQK